MAVANIIPTALTDGIPYSSSVPLTTTEADLNGGTNVPTSPIGIADGQTIVAVVKLSINGLVGGNNSYVVMQTDLGDGTWIDVAWAVWTGKQGLATFVLCGGGLGQENNAFQQTRSNSPPASSGSNVVPLGGRVRFVGASSFNAGSSSLSGLTTAVSATITYRLQHPR